MGGSAATATVRADRASRLPRDRGRGTRCLEPDHASRARLRRLGAREAPLRPTPDAQARRASRSRREQLAEKRRLGDRGRQRSAVRVRQGNREHDLRQSVLHAAVRRVAAGWARARRVPLCTPRSVERCRSGGLLRDQRRRLDGRQPDTPRRARHRIQPVWPDVLRPEPERHGLVDRRLPERVPRPHRPLGDDLYDHQLVAAVHGELPRFRRQPAVDRPLERHRRPAPGRLEHVHVLAVDEPAGRVPGRPGRLQRLPGRLGGSRQQRPTGTSADPAATTSPCDPVPRPARDRHAPCQGASSDPPGELLARPRAPRPCPFAARRKGPGAEPARRLAAFTRPQGQAGPRPP